jgi:hypothetical protein
MTAEQVARKMRKRQELVAREFTQTTRGVAVSALAFAKQKLTEEIYSVPEDLSASGKKRQASASARGKKFTAVGRDKAWRRTGHLRRSEKFEIRDPYTVAIVNTAAYALPRHEAGKPGHRNINPARVSHWHDDLRVAFNEGLLRGLYHDTMVDILKAEG